MGRMGNGWGRAVCECRRAQCAVAHGGQPCTNNTVFGVLVYAGPSDKDGVRLCGPCSTDAILAGGVAR